MRGRDRFSPSIVVLVSLTFATACTNKQLRELSALERAAFRFGFVSTGAARLDDYDLLAASNARGSLQEALDGLRDQVDSITLAQLQPETLRATIEWLTREFTVNASLGAGSETNAPGSEGEQSPAKGNGQGGSGDDVSRQLQDLVDLISKTSVAANPIALARLKLGAYRYLASEELELNLNESTPRLPGYRRLILSLQLTAHVRKQSGANGVAVYVDLYPHGAEEWTHVVGRKIEELLRGFPELAIGADREARERAWSRLRACIQQRLDHDWPEIERLQGELSVPRLLDLPRGFPEDPYALAHVHLASSGLVPRIIYVDPLDEGALVREGGVAGLYDLADLSVGVTAGSGSAELAIRREGESLAGGVQARVHPFNLAFAAGDRRAGWLFLPRGSDYPTERRIRLVVDVPDSLKLLSVHVHRVFLDSTLMPMEGNEFGHQLEYINRLRVALSRLEPLKDEIPPIMRRSQGADDVEDHVPATATEWSLAKSAIRNLRHQAWSESLVVPVPPPTERSVSPPVMSRLRSSRYALHGDVVLTSNGSVHVESGRWVVIEDGRILDVASEPPEGVPSLKVDGYILPGLIDLHDHLSYNFCPRFSGTIFKDKVGLFANRYEWRREPAYQDVSTWHRERREEDRWFEQAAIAYAEIRELVGGTTSVASYVQQRPGWENVLARNLDGWIAWDASGPRITNQVFFFDRDRLAETPPQFIPLKGTLEAIRQSDVCILHLCEGRKDDPITQEEYARFVEWARLHREDARKIVLVHALALEAEHFRELAELGINRAVWSPYSNLVLYGETMDVTAALRAGFTISLGTDWYPSGTDSLFDEARVARGILQEGTDGLGTADAVIEMLLMNAARIVGIHGKLGTLQPGSLADLVVIPRGGNEAFHDAVFSADVDTLSLVIVGGHPMYGETRLMNQLCEEIWPSPVQGRDRAFGVRCAEIADYVRDATGGSHPWLPSLAPLESLGDWGDQR